jgi:WhiB family redox-sensing transcriptional regulator
MRSADRIPQGGRWRSQAACRSADPGLFYPTGTGIIAMLQVANARQVCAICAVRPQCLRWALENDRVLGVCGGTTEAERLILRQLAVNTAGLGAARHSRTASGSVG